MRFLHPSYLKAFAGGLLSNRSGVRIAEKLIIIESDDWGAIRTPSREAVERSAQFGMDIQKSRFKVDSLASEEDLDDLFNLLLQFKDVDGNPPVITANCIMANPDFDRIRQSDFKEYFYEPFTQTLARYPKHANCFLKWKSAMDMKLFSPQLHGREHLNIKRWMSALQSNDPNVRFSFDLQSTYSGVGDYSFMGAFDWDDESDVNQHIHILTDSFRLFKETFGFESNSFIAPCYTWDSRLDEVLGKANIAIVQNASCQLQPIGKNGDYKRIRHVFGERSKHNFIYNNRNVFFEPVTNPYLDWTDKVAARIATAFLLGKPAVISTHRVNYVGFIDPKNKDNGLRHLTAILKTIQRKWPDAKFISTGELTKYLI